MNDNELADKVVEIGVGDHAPQLERSDIYSIRGELLRDDYFVRDWRVAGALMEGCLEKYERVLVRWHPEEMNLAQVVDYGELLGSNGDDNVARAIIEACVEALS